MFCCSNFFVFCYFSNVLFILAVFLFYCFQYIQSCFRLVTKTSPVSITFLENTVLSPPEGHLIHRTTAKLDVNEQKRFEVSFCSDQSLTLQTTMTVQVMDNQYSNSSIHVTGEAVQRTVSFNNFRRSWQDGEDEVGGMNKGGN